MAVHVQFHYLMKRVPVDIAGKVCVRHWYDKNKHIFPASRWEAYDPEKDYSEYTVK